MVDSTQHKRDVHTKLTHLARDPLYLRQKPFAAYFATDEQESNHSFETIDVTVRDARPMKSSFTLEKNGFCFLDCATSANYNSLKSEKSSVEDYHLEMENLVRGTFPEYKRVEVIDHGVGTSFQITKVSSDGDDPLD